MATGSPIDWRHCYNPTVIIGATEFKMPLPLMTREESFSKTFKRIKVPLLNGEIVSGVSRGALNVSVTGIISQDPPEGVLHLKQRLMDILVNTAGTYAFYTHRDDARSNFRWYADCTTERLSFSANNRSRYSYNYTLSFIVPGGTENELITTRSEQPVSGVIKGVDPSIDGDLGINPAADSQPDRRTLLFGPVVIRLPDNDGTSAFVVKDAVGDVIFKIASDGTVESIQPVTFPTSITWPNVE